MRRLLDSPPKDVRHELIGNLIRATINASELYKPFAFTPARPHACPVCGEDAGKAKDHIPTIISLDFSDAPTLDLITWSHRECSASCIETNEPDRNIE